MPWNSGQLGEVNEIFRAPSNSLSRELSETASAQVDRPSETHRHDDGEGVRVIGGPDLGG